MLRRFSCFAVLLAVALLFVSQVASAALVDFNIPDEGPGDPTTNAQCLIGETRAGNIATLGVIEPGAKFYQLLDPAQCLACSLVTGRAIESAVIRMRFLSACDVVFRVQIVGASGGPACYAPDTANVLCMPSVQIVGEPAGQITTKNYTMTINNGCCIETASFLSIEVVSMTCESNQIGNPFALPCSPCTQYIVSPTYLPPGIAQQCEGGFSRNFRMWTEADCCGAVPTLPRSWGSLKTLYR